MTWIGDGSTKAGVVHEGFNFAAVRRAPVIFIIQNNHVALGTRLEQHHVSEDFSDWPRAYGMWGGVFDGNNVLDAYALASMAVERCRRGEGPAMLVAETFRMGGHSSSDDPTRYRDAALVAYWEERDPMARLRAWLTGEGALAPGEEERWTQEMNEEIGAAITEAESLPPPPIESMFADVYRDMPRHLSEQMRYAVAMGKGQKFEGAFPL